MELVGSFEVQGRAGREFRENKRLEFSGQSIGGRGQQRQGTPELA